MDAASRVLQRWKEGSLPDGMVFDAEYLGSVLPGYGSEMVRIEELTTGFVHLEVVVWFAVPFPCLGTLILPPGFQRWKPIFLRNPLIRRFCGLQHFIHQLNLRAGEHCCSLPTGNTATVEWVFLERFVFSMVFSVHRTSCLLRVWEITAEKTRSWSSKIRSLVQGCQREKPSLAPWTWQGFCFALAALWIFGALVDSKQKGDGQNGQIWARGLKVKSPNSTISWIFTFDVDMCVDVCWCVLMCVDMCWYICCIHTIRTSSGKEKVDPDHGLFPLCRKGEPPLVRIDPVLLRTTPLG